MKPPAAGFKIEIASVTQVTLCSKSSFCFRFFCRIDILVCRLYFATGRNVCLTGLGGDKITQRRQLLHKFS
jgi:hypothetical protein